MKTRLEQVLERYLHGREIAVWGTPTRSLLRVLQSYPFHIADQLDPEKHYVVAVNDDDLDDFFMDAQSEAFAYVQDYLTFNDPGGELPFAWECHGVQIGRETYFGEAVAGACREGYVQSIGHFTSIHGSADIAVNHQFDMTFVSDDIQQLFTQENRALFQKRLRSNPNHPYAYNKAPITIGNDVYIGANVFINASKVTSIGDGAIIGSGAVVLEDVPPYAVVVGVPAKIKKYRYPVQMIETLLRVKWWDWSVEELNKNADALMSSEVFMERFGIGV